MEWLQNQTARKYLKSYLTISIIPVLVLFVVGCFAVGIMGNRRAEQSMQAELELLKNDLDASITFMGTGANCGGRAAASADPGVSGELSASLHGALLSPGRELDLCIR